LPVLVYHHIQPEAKSDVSCTPQQFETQIKAILAAGYKPINLEQTSRFLLGTLSDKIERPVLITFDDGYESLYHYALPVARECLVPMTVFIVTSRIGRRPQFADYLDELQIKEMMESGFWDFGSHTHDLHTDILRIIEAFGTVKANPVLRLVARDLALSSARLESITGKKPVAIAWPYGKFSSDTTALARLAGYRLHFTSILGYNEVGANPFAIKRIPVSSRDTAFSVLKKISQVH
jgi:peptidoglycan/xylan/chitin deacetylase (PgdA/CDA1 family)